jgi:hypothetical protein
MRNRLYRPFLLVLGTLAFAAGANGSTITLSNVSSDATPASQLDGTLEFDVGEFDGGNAGDELRITLTNPALVDGGSALFNITAIYWNGSDAVTGLTLLTASHSAAGDVFTDWNPIEVPPDPDAKANGFGFFDFALTDGTGETNVAIVEPGESIVFILDIAGVGVTMSDFVEGNENGYLAAAKFTNGPDDPETPGSEDSAFGATLPVPEPSGALMFGFGLVAAAAGRSRR